MMRTSVAAVAALLAAIVLAMSGLASAADPVQARKDLKATGIEYNEQAFAKAAGNDDMTAVQLFLDAGMDVNSGGGAAIGLAAGRGEADLCGAWVCAHARTRRHREDPARRGREGLSRAPQGRAP